MAAERRAAMRAILRIRSEHAVSSDDAQATERPMPSPKRAPTVSSLHLPSPHSTTAWTRDEVVSVLRRTFDVCREARSGAVKSTSTALPEIAHAHVHGTAMITTGLSATAPPQAPCNTVSVVVKSGATDARHPDTTQKQTITARRRKHRGGTPPSLAGVPRAREDDDGVDAEMFVTLSRAKKLIATQRALQRASKRSVLSSRGEPSCIPTVHIGDHSGGVSFARMPAPPITVSGERRSSPPRDQPEFVLQFPADFERLASRSPQAALRKKTTASISSPLANGKLHRGSQLAGVAGVIPGSELVRRTVPLLNGIDNLTLTTTGFRLSADITSLLRTVSSPRDDPLGS